MESSNKTLIVIAGPTASGKTAIAIKIARHFKTVIVSADSRQLYREMSIGTAKPDQTELSEIKHHFINSHLITNNFTAGDYQRECIALLEELFKQHDKIVLAGGSGLFIKAIIEGFDDLPASNEIIRSKLNQQFLEKGIGYLQDRLKFTDPVYYKEVDIHNPQRIIRALEIFENTGQKFSALRKALSPARIFEVISFGLMMERKTLYERINTRVEQMIANGLLQEVESLVPYRNLNALNTVGYSELFNHIDGHIDLETAISSIQQNTRRYAKRQMTWFRKDKNLIWMDALSPTLLHDIIKQVNEFN